MTHDMEKNMEKTVNVSGANLWSGHVIVIIAMVISLKKN